jgi:transcriptional regulator with XRE-family HTH domain
MAFAELIKKARKRLRLSQASLGGEIGVWNTYVGQIEKGEKVPSDEVVIKLAKVLDLNLNELLLSAYKAKADSTEAQNLFARMETALNDPVLQQIVSSSNALAPGVLAALGDENICQALTEETWRESFSRCYAVNTRKKRDIQVLLTLVESMNDKQYSAMMNLLEAMELEAEE